MKSRGAAACLMTGGLLADARERVAFVRSPEGKAVPDLREKLPGERIFVTARRDVLEEAFHSGRLSAALNAQPVETQKMLDLLVKLLNEQCLQWLHAAKRAGALIQGFDKGVQCLDRGDARLAILASDAANDTARKWLRAVEDVPLINCFSKEQLSESLNSDTVFTCGVIAGEEGKGITRAFLADICKYEGIARLDFEEKLDYKHLNT